jgi:murein DD-endopeptidase MepM/ murein hydrolase activator NlpD
MNGWTANRGGARRAALLLLIALLAASGPGSASETSLPVSISVRARAVAPSEPVRFEVHSPETLQSLRGEFLGEPVFFFRSSKGDGREIWSGWALVGLDTAAGLTSIEVRGQAADGREVLGSLAVSVEARQFPEEQLSVEPKYVEPPREVQERLAQERQQLRAVYASRRPVLPAVDAFVRPVSGEPTSIFGTRRVFNGKPRSPHSGLDLRAETGTPVHCSGPGRVTLAMDLYYSGNTVIVDHGAGLFTIYAHLSELQVEVGEEVEAGQVLGLSGATGRVTGPHLHWGAKIGSRPFDPTALLDPQLFR